MARGQVERSEASPPRTPNSRRDEPSGAKSPRSADRGAAAAKQQAAKAEAERLATRAAKAAELAAAEERAEEVRKAAAKVVVANAVKAVKERARVREARVEAVMAERRRVAAGERYWIGEGDETQAISLSQEREEAAHMVDVEEARAVEEEAGAVEEAVVEGGEGDGSGSDTSEVLEVGMPTLHPRPLTTSQEAMDGSQLAYAGTTAQSSGLRGGGALGYACLQGHPDTVDIRRPQNAGLAVVAGQYTGAGTVDPTGSVAAGYRYQPPAEGRRTPVATVEEVVHGAEGVVVHRPRGVHMPGYLHPHSLTHLLLTD